MRSRREIQDAIAREAARLLAVGRAANLTDALLLARESSGDSRGRSPSAQRVRRHAQGQAMQSIGEAAYAAERTQRLRLAEECMTALEHALPDAQTLLTGRAALGHFDADPTIHIRLLTSRSVTETARSLAILGYEEPRFTTMESRFGRLSQIEYSVDGVRIMITRCASRAMFDSPKHLVTGDSIRTLTLAALRAAIGADSQQDVNRPAVPPV